MNKITVTIIWVVLLGAFFALIVVGIRGARGVPVEIEEKQKVILKIAKLDQQIDLSQGLGDDVWQGIKALKVELIFQLMVEPWSKGLTDEIQVKAFHNDKEVYFYVTWKDATENWTVKPDAFTDGCAIMFPSGIKEQPVSLMMGFLGQANIWHWKASQDYAFWQGRNSDAPDYSDFHYPFEEEELFPVSLTEVTSAVSDLTAIRVSTLTPKEKQIVAGRGKWTNGVWEVVFKRALDPVDKELDADVRVPVNRLIAFAVWNGVLQDRGGRKSISEWVTLNVK